MSEAVSDFFVRLRGQDFLTKPVEVAVVKEPREKQLRITVFDDAAFQPVTISLAVTTRLPSGFECLFIS